MPVQFSTFDSEHKNERSAIQYKILDLVSEQCGRVLFTLQPVDHRVIFLIEKNVERVIAP